MADSLPSTAAAHHAAVYLGAQGYTAPGWGGGDAASRRGLQTRWQRRAAHACDERAFETAFRTCHLPHERCLLSQASAHFRVLLLRRLRLPLQLAPRTCACRRPQDVLGDHRTACATAGVLASRAIPLERALARVCREAGARVARNVRLADMNLDVPMQDARRIEVVCNGLPLWQLMPRSSAPSAGTASPAPAPMPVPASFLPRLHAANNAKLMPSWSGRAAAAWWCSGCARALAFLPPSQGGLSLLAAERISPAACWAAWADALPVLRQRYPEAADRLLHDLTEARDPPCLQAAAAAAVRLDEAGWADRPGWEACAGGAPVPPSQGELGLGGLGWQRHAVLALHTFFRERELLPAIPPASSYDPSPVLRGSQPSHAIPTDAATTLAPDLMHLALRRWGRSPRLPGGDRWDSMGLGTTTSPAPAQACCLAAASSLSTHGCRSCGKRWGPKDAWCHSSGFACTTAPQVPPDDRRRLDFVVYGGAVTLVSPLTRAGHPVPGADARDGVALAAARRRKAACYPELRQGDPQKLVVLAAEIGGRWSDECRQFLRQLLRLTGMGASLVGLPVVALQRAVASSVLGVWTMPPLPGAPDGVPLGDVLDFAEAAAPSRLQVDHVGTSLQGKKVGR